jgi:hypothetical protein
VQRVPLRYAPQPRLATSLLLGLVIQTSVGSAAAFARTPSASDQGAMPKGQPAGTPTQLTGEFERSPDTVVDDVNGVSFTLGMVADRLHEFPAQFAVLPPRLAIDPRWTTRSSSAPWR